MNNIGVYMYLFGGEKVLLQTKGIFVVARSFTAAIIGILLLQKQIKNNNCRKKYNLDASHKITPLNRTVRTRTNFIDRRVKALPRNQKI